MFDTFLILPHQLFPKLPEAKKYILYEHPKYLTKKYGNVKYTYVKKCLDAYYKQIKGTKERTSTAPKGKCDAMFDPIDDISVLAKEYLPSPAFLIENPRKVIKELGTDFTHVKFYNWHSNHLFGNSLKSTDKKNREPLPKGHKLPKEKYKLRDVCTRRMALNVLKDFISGRFAKYGKYQDAILPEDALYGYHSALSPFLNNGLIVPQDVLSAVSESKGIPQNSKEGFLRQLIGWREYVRLIYVRDYAGRGNIRANYFGNRKSLDKSWYVVQSLKSSKLPPPVQTAINKMMKEGYIPHIERLMVVALFMNLCQIKPQDVFTWFMYSIDSYDWVMYPNVYGMALGADMAKKSPMMKKPYLASDTYIAKMSSGRWNKLKNANEYSWKKLWHALYYKFIINNSKKLESTPHIRGLTNWNAKSEKEKKELTKIYLDFI